MAASPRTSIASWDYSNVDRIGDMESDISSNSEGEDKNDQERNSSADREDDIKPDTSTQTSRTEEESSTGWRKLPSSEEIEDEGDNRSEYRLNTTKAPKHPQVPISHPVHTAKTQCSTLVQRWGLFYAFWDNSWMPELLSCLVSVLALGGLLLVLGVYQGDVLQDLPIRLSINAIIAIFAAIIKASLIMPVAEAISQHKWLYFTRDKVLADFERIDKASRGPWGSFLLILQLRSRHFVTFGALITLFALAIDPFSQQLVSFRSCSQGITNDTAHLPHTHNLVNTKDGWGTFANRMSAAAYLSLLGEPMGPSSMNYSCSTGNCSFALHGTVGPSHQTLAIGSECADISHLVEENTDVTQTNVSVSFGPQWHLPHFSDTNTTIPEASVHGAKYIGRMKSMSWEEFGNSYSTTMDGDALFRFTILTVNLDWTDIDRIRVPSNLVGQGQDQKGNNTTMQNPGGQGVDYLIMPKSRPLAVECQLNPEIQTLQSRIVNGALWEKVLDTETGSWEPNGNTSYAFVPKQVLHKKAWKDCEPSPNPTKEFPENTTSSDGKVQRWYPEGCVWNLDTNAHLMIRRALYPHFGHLLEIDHALQPYAALKYNFSHMWMEDLYNNGTASYDSIVAFAAELASSMTTAIRNWGATELNWVEGKVYKMETCVAVNWGWVIVPASLVLAAIEFLLLTIWASPSRKTQQGPWKSSSLAVLFHGLDSGVRKSCGDLPRRSEMWERAEEVQVRLRNDVDGLKLK